MLKANGSSSEESSHRGEFDLSFVKVLERYYSDYEIPGMVYEYIADVGSWYRVEIPGFSPNEKFLKPFFLKKKINREDLSKYATTSEELERLNSNNEITLIYYF